MPSPLGFSRIGFIAGSGSSPHASACATCARPISPPARHGNELFDMFCALNGATRTPFERSHAQMAVTIQLLPAFDDVPPTKNGLATLFLLDIVTAGPPERAATRPIRPPRRPADQARRARPSSRRRRGDS